MMIIIIKLIEEEMWMLLKDWNYDEIMIDKLCVQFRVFDWLSWYKDYFEDV